MSAPIIHIPETTIALARGLRDAIVHKNSSVLAAYREAHLAEQARSIHRFEISGHLGDVLVAEPEAILSLLNISCENCRRIASFALVGRTIVLTENGTNTESDEILLARSSKFIKLMREGIFDGSISNAVELASDPAFDALIVSG